MAEATIDSLKLEISSSSDGASKGLDALSKSLKKLQSVTSKGLGLTAVVNELKSADTSIKSSSLDGLTKAVETLSKLGGVKISASIGNQITSISAALQGANFDGGAEKMQSLVTALEPLGQLDKSNLSSYVTSLKKLPETFAELNKIDMDAVTAKVQELATALKPLGDEMQKVANGFSAFPAKIQKLITSTEKLTLSNNKASTSYINLYAKIKMAASGVKTIGKKIGSWISLSSDYTETMNLFTVSMGQYAEAAYNYAQDVGNAMGIDPKEWMQHQGVFMTLTKGFGVAGDRANKMSQQLTQLGYDLSSFYNISVEDAMTKLESGIAGELEPLRRLGYDLSQAKLEEIAFGQSIDKSVSSMTQAEKAELRYLAIMTQVTDAHHDMARTLDAPANQMRILNAQITQLGRALGNFFIPILNKVLPYLIASVKVLREVLDVFMDLLGIELTEVDFGKGSITSATDDIVTNLEDGQKEAKKLKSYMLGFDELNVLNTDEDSDLEELLGSGFNFDLPTYDIMDGIVATQVDEITEKMREWAGLAEDIDVMDSKFGDILVTVGAIGAGIASWKIGRSIINFTKNTLPKWKGLLKDKNFMKGFTITLGVSLAVTGLVLGADVITDAITDGLSSVDVGELVASSALIIAGGTLIGKAFGKALTGSAISAIVIGVAGLGVALYDAIKNELNITNGLTLAFSAALIGAGVGYLINGALGAAMGSLMGVVIGGAAAGAIWIIQNVEDTVAKVFGIVSAATLAAGAILAFSGINVPLGIGLMAVGAVSMGSQIAMNVDAIPNEIKGVIAVITTTVSAALLAVGAILAFTGANIPLGIGLMAGGVFMGASVVPNWDSLTKGVQNTISAILAVVGAGALAMGAVLAFTGAGIPLGIGLMLAGAASLGTAVALNWNSLVTSLQGTLGKILAIVGVASMVIGLILLFTGVGTGLGLGLLLGGAASLGTAIAFNWNSIVDSIKGVWKNITDWWHSTASKVFTKEFWANLASYIGQGLVNGWNNMWAKIKEWWNGFIDKIKDILGIHSPSTVFAEIGKYLIEGLLNGLKSVFNGVITWFNTNLITPISNAFSGIWDTMKNGASSAWTGVKNVFSSVATFFRDTFQNAWEKVKGVFSTGGQIFSGITTGITTAFKAIVNTIIKGINNVVAIPFNAINTALTTIRDIKFLNIQPFKNVIKTITVPQIPLLASGGFPEQGQMFIAREAGAELVGNIGGRTAVMNNDQIVESVSAGVYQAVLAALGSSNEDEGNTNIVINLDGEKIYENQQKIARGRGYNLGMGAFSFG